MFVYFLSINNFSPISAGSPNITGTFARVIIVNDGCSGAFKYLPKYLNGVAGGTSKAHYVDFAASYSNPVYGNSTTVTPESLATRWFIKF